MSITATVRVLVATTVVAGIVASSALAGGEPKNMAPFTHHVGNDNQIALSAMFKRATAALLPAGEPKNEYPFTRR